MIISQQVDAVEFGGLEDSSVTSFGIKQSAEAFMILSSTLYTNKIQAIIREVSCNAVDAHAMAGTPDLPIEVHLPTYFEPHFHVRDFGTGLSDEDIRTVYTVYFESTKRASNNQVGGFGLGCKSPFSYTQNFTITSIFEGKKTIYSAFINDKGFPDIINLGVSDSDEHSGITVSFPVKDTDMSRFKDEAKYVYSFFNVKPTMVGEHVDTNTMVKQLDLTDKSYTYTSSMWNMDKCYAVVGGVSYPITLDSSELKLKYRDILSSKVINNFGIGELTIHPSRETLSYDKRTIDAIVARFDEISSTIYDKVSDELSKFTNAWELTNYHDEVLNKATAISKIAYNNYRKNNPDKFIAYNTLIKGDDVELLNLSVIKPKSKSCVINKVNVYMDSKNEKHLHIQSEIINNSVFISDGQPKTTKRIRQYALEKCHNWRSYAIIEPTDLTKPFDSAKVLELMRNPLNVVTMDMLPEIEKKSRVTGYTRRKFVKGLFTTTKNFYQFEKVQSDEIPSTTKYYVVIDDNKRIQSKFGDNLFSGYVYRDYSRIMNGSQLNNDAYNVFAILESELDNIIVNSNEWVNYDNMLYDEVVKKAKSKEVFNFKVINNINVNKLFKMFENKLDKTHKCMVLLDKYNDMKNNSVSSTTYEFDKFVKSLLPNFDKDVQKEVDLFNEMCKDIEMTYPMLKYVNEYEVGKNDSNLQDVLDYINTIDNSMKGTN